MVGLFPDHRGDSFARLFLVLVGLFILRIQLPEFIGKFALGVIRWSTRTSAWFMGLADTYPPFSFD